MNRIPDRDELLDDVLQESSPARFRVVLLADTLLYARRRRLQRRASRAVLAAVVAGASGLFVWRHAPPGPTPEATRATYAVVYTQPFSSAAIVTTRAFGDDRIVATVTTVIEVRTQRGAGGLRLVNDDELLALAAPRLPVLVRSGPDTQELIFLKETESDAKRVN